MVDQKYFIRVVTYRTEKSAVSFFENRFQACSGNPEGNGQYRYFQTGADGKCKRTKKITTGRDKKIHLGLNFS